MKFKFRKAALTIIQISGIFGLASFFQNILFLKDTLLYLSKNIENIVSLFRYVVIAAGFLVESYRDIVYPIFKIIPFDFPTIWIDIFLSIVLSQKFAALFYFGKKVEWLKFYSTPLLENDIITKEAIEEIKEIYNLSFFKFFKNKENKVKLGQYNILVIRNFKLIHQHPTGLLKIADMTNVGVLSFVFLSFIIFIWILDLYYRFYIIS